MLRDDESEQHAPWDPKDTFLGVELDDVLPELPEGLLQVSHKLVGMLGLDYDVIYVSLNGPPNEVSKAFGHATLVHSPSILESEQHRNVAERSKRGDERGCELVGLFHHDLMVPGVCIKEA